MTQWESRLVMGLSVLVIVASLAPRAVSAPVVTDRDYLLTEALICLTFFVYNLLSRCVFQSACDFWLWGVIPKMFILVLSG